MMVSLLEATDLGAAGAKVSLRGGVLPARHRHMLKRHLMEARAVAGWASLSALQRRDVEAGDTTRAGERLR